MEVRSEIFFLRPEGFPHKSPAQQENQAEGHHNTIFRQSLQLVDRRLSRRIERQKLKRGCRCRQLNRWQRFTAMMFVQPGGLCRQGDFAQQFEGQSRILYHLGLRPVKPSTPAGANAKPSAALAEATFFRRSTPSAWPWLLKEKVHFHSRLHRFDSSKADFCLPVFPWAKFRRLRRDSIDPGQQ